MSSSYGRFETHKKQKGMMEDPSDDGSFFVTVVGLMAGGLQTVLHVCRSPVWSSVRTLREVTVGLGLESMTDEHEMPTTDFDHRQL